MSSVLSEIPRVIHAACGSRKEARIHGGQFFSAIDKEVCCVSMFFTWSGVRGDCHRFFFIGIFLGTSVSERKCVVVKHSSIVVWTSTHMTLLRTNHLPDIVWAAVETLYSSIVIVMRLRMVESSWLYKYVWVYYSHLDFWLLRTVCSRSALMVC